MVGAETSYKIRMDGWIDDSAVFFYGGVLFYLFQYNVRVGWGNIGIVRVYTCRSVSA